MNQSSERQKFMRARSELMSSIDILRACNEKDIASISRALERVDRAAALLREIGGVNGSLDPRSTLTNLPRL